MKWFDERIKFLKNFSEIKIGEGFEYGNMLCIKVDKNLGFDVINNRIEAFGSGDKVYIRDTEIIFH